MSETYVAAAVARAAARLTLAAEIPCTPAAPEAASTPASPEDEEAHPPAEPVDTSVFIKER